MDQLPRLGKRERNLSAIVYLLLLPAFLRPHFGAVGIAGLYIGRLRNCLPFLTSFKKYHMADLHIKRFDINSHQ